MALVSGFGVTRVCNEEGEIGDLVSGAGKMEVNSVSQFVQRRLKVLRIAESDYFCREFNDPVFGWSHDTV